MRVRLKVLFTRLTADVLHLFVREWLASSHLRVTTLRRQEELHGLIGADTLRSLVNSMQYDLFKQH